MTHPSKTRTIAIVRDAFNGAPVISCGFRNVVDMLFSECLAAEREHRKYKPASCESPSWTAHRAAQYFTVKYLREYMSAAALPTIREYLHIRHECFTAASIVENYGEQLREWVNSIPSEFDAIDYARMSQWNYYAERDAK